MRNRIVYRGALAAVLAGCSGVLGQAIPIRKVVVTGEQAPGAPAGRTFFSFQNPLMASDGSVYFHGTFLNPDEPPPLVGGPATDSGIWRAVGASLSAVAKEGDPLPGGPVDATVEGFSDLTTDGVQGVFQATLAGTGVSTSNDRAILRGGAAGSSNVLVREGDSAPDVAPDRTFNGFSFMSGNGGHIGFFGGSSGPSGSTGGVWAGPAGALHAIRAAGDPAPGLSGVTINAFGVPQLDGSGRAVFSSVLAGSGITTSNDSAIWHGTRDSLQLVARDGAATPIDAGVTYSFLLTPSTNDAGRVAFLAHIAGAGVTSANDRAVFAGDPGALQVVARRGEQAPQAPAGITFSSFDDAIQLDGAGGVAFRAFLAGAGVTTANDTGIWAGAAGSLQVIMRDGDAAPGGGPGVVFNNFGIDTLDAPVVNDLGQVAFRAVLTGPGVTSANDGGIWATDPMGQLRLVLREGDLLEVSSGVFQPVTGLEMLTGVSEGNGAASPFNSRGELAFRASYAGGSGVFVAMIPEPAGASLVGCAVSILLLRRRRRV